MSAALTAREATTAASSVAEIAGYTNLEVIGRGGFAVVYKAEQTSVGRNVAIKLLIDPSPDDDLVRRFQRESRAVGALSWHPHIAAVVDAGTTVQGQAYIVFELLAGGSLEEKIEQAPMRWQDGLSAMIQIADAVEAAHHADVLHRDIKPANILLDRLGVAKLGDFGIASMQDGNKTETGMLATTVAHAAPELFDGVAASPATDVYALGSTLHTLVTGLAPFAPGPDERISATISRIINEPPPRPDPAVVPIAISTAIAHALAKQPEYRPRSAAGFGKALQQTQRDLGQPVTAMPFSDSTAAAEGTAQDIAGSTGQGVPEAPLPPTFAVQADPISGRHASLVDAFANSPLPDDGEAAQLPPTLASGPTNVVAPAPFSRTIALLSAVAMMLVIAVGALVLYQARTTVTPAAITQGGARVLTVAASNGSQVNDAPALMAFDGSVATAWQIAPNPATGMTNGTVLVITLSEEQTITSVGIAGQPTDGSARPAELRWAADKAEIDARSATVVIQTVEDQAEPQTVDFRRTTDQLVVALFDVHGESTDPAAISEILIEVE